MKKKIFISICVFLGLLGVVLKLTSYEVLQSLGSSIITSIVVSLIWQCYIAGLDEMEMNQRFGEKVEDIKSNISALIKKEGKRIENIINDTNKNDEMLRTIGLKYVRKDRAFLTNNIEKILYSSKTSVKIMGESLSSFLDRPDFVDTLKEILKKGIEVKILLLSLESDTLEERYKELGLKLEESVGIHKNALKKYFELSQENYEYKYEMKLFKYHPKILLIISDDQVVYTQHYSPGMKGYEAPLYEYDGGEVVKYYCRVFNNVWKAESTVEASAKEIEKMFRI